MKNEFDIIVIGSGIVGATTALALTKLTSLSIALLDAKPITLPLQRRGRVSAISPASQAIFQNLNSWSGIATNHCSPYQAMHVWDESSEGVLHFEAKKIGKQALGFIVDDVQIQNALLAEIASQNQITLFPETILTNYFQTSDTITLTSTTENSFQAKLVIGADGAHSWLREKLNVPLKEKNYHHTALVAEVVTEKPHDRTAWQRFLTTGPLAFLPLAEEKTSSIVWSTTPEEAEKLCQLEEHAFLVALTKAFDNKLGDVTHVTRRATFPLKMRHANHYVYDHIAFVGDAAHTIHPLAGQGLNLGLLDAVALAEVISDAFQKNRRYYSRHALRRYERWRKADNVLLLAFVDFIKSIYLQSNAVIQQCRSTGMNFINQSEKIKQFIASIAMGHYRDLPQLAALQPRGV